MAQRFGLQTIKDALVTLIGTTNVSDLNSGLARSVQQVITRRLDDETPIPDTKYPTVNIAVANGNSNFRGASKRKETRVVYEIECWAKKYGSVDTSLDEIEKLIENIIYIIDGNVSIAEAANGILNATGFTKEAGTSANGFVSKGRITLEVYRALN